MKCAYCGKTKSPEEMTAEHVIPRSLGGGINDASNPFKLKNVCKQCNNVAGIYIDAVFSKSWFLQNAKTLNYLKYADIRKDPILPLMYMGAISLENCHDLECDVWIAPAATNVFHFHKPYDSEDRIYSTGIRPRSKSGDQFVFIVFSSNNTAWHSVVLRSIYHQFPKTVFYIGNPIAEFDPRSGITKLPNHLIPLKDEILTKISKKLDFSFPIQPDFADRFLSKLAIGFGTLFLSDYINSNSAIRMRSFMWERDASVREMMQIRGSNFFNSPKMGVVDLVGWRAGHVFILMVIENHVVLSASFFGQEFNVIEVSRESQHCVEVGKHGKVFIISPFYKKYIGPTTLVKYISVKQGFISNEISDFLDTYSREVDNPPFSI